MRLIPHPFRRQTLASFDYQWRELPTGDALLSDDWFRSNLDRILADELLALEGEWFRGKRVLDAGAGAGRWTVGLLRLGCDVLAVDASAHALERVRENVDEHCTSDEARRLGMLEVDLLDPPSVLAERPFDLVFSFGVLHHTGDTARALQNVARLVGPDGVLFLYLYGRASLTGLDRAVVGVERVALAPLPYRLKTRVLSLLYRRADPHAVFDLLSPTINTRHTFAEVERQLHTLGFPTVEQTIPHSELFVRALRDGASVRPYLRHLTTAPYWFERYA